MGTWGVSKKELIERLTDLLDEIEGDFDTKNLIDALEFMKFYAPTSDSDKVFERIWRKKLDAVYTDQDCEGDEK